MLRPAYKEFARLARKATLVPVVKSVAADLLTPVSAFLAIAAGEPHAFLLESVERGEQVGRYTFLGARPYMRVRSRGGQITVERGKRREQRSTDVFQLLKELLRAHRPANLSGLPPFTAGAVGYFAYDVVRTLENIGEHAEDDLGLPDAELMFFDRVLAFDHVRHQIHIIATAAVARESPRHAYDRAVRDFVSSSGQGEKLQAQGARRDQPPAFYKSGGAGEGIHRGGRHLPGGAFAAAGFCSRGGALRYLPRAAYRKSFALPLFSAHERYPCAGFVAGDAGARQRTQARVPPHRRHPSPRTRPLGRRTAGAENAARRKRAGRARHVG